MDVAETCLILQIACTSCRSFGTAFVRRCFTLMPHSSEAISSGGTESRELLGSRLAINLMQGMRSFFRARAVSIDAIPGRAISRPQGRTDICTRQQDSVATPCDGDICHLTWERAGQGCVPAPGYRYAASKTPSISRLQI